jgi:hypothetical protein
MRFGSIFARHFFTAPWWLHGGRIRRGDGADHHPRRSRHLTVTQEREAMDVVVLAIGLGFFALMFGYVSACEKL